MEHGFVSTSLIIYFLISSQCLMHGLASNHKEFTNQNRCQTDVVYSNAQQFIWKYEDDGAAYVASRKNLCWNNTANKIVLRKCNPSTKQWTPAKVNCEIANVQNTRRFCPEDLIEIPVGDKYICISISKQPQQQRNAQRFCYGSDTVASVEYLKSNEAQTLAKYLLKHNITSYWLPVTRSYDYAYDPYIVRLPGKYWGNMFDMPITALNLTTGEHCMSTVIDGDFRLQSRISHCDSLRHTVCVFRKEFVATSGCPQGFAAMSHKPSDCYGILWEAGLFPLVLQPVSLAEYFTKRYSLQMIFDRIELLPTEYFMVDKFADENGEYSVEMDLKEDIQVVVIEDSEKYNPGLSLEVLFDRKEVELTLKRSTDEEYLILTVYNRHYIWRLGDEDSKDNIGIRCFTNADYEIRKSVRIKIIWENESLTKTMFKLKINTDSAGLYWCEAHTVFNFTFVESPTIYVTNQEKGHTFALLYKLECDVAKYCLDVYDHLKSVAKQIRKELNFYKDNERFRTEFDELLINDVRVMGIEAVASQLDSITYICHVSASLIAFADGSGDSSEERDVENYQYVLKNGTALIKLFELLTNFMHNYKHQLESNVRCIEYCLPELFRKSAEGIENKWNLVKRGQTATTQNLCLQRNGLPAMRKCNGGFLYGAHWGEIVLDNDVCITDTQEKTITKVLYELELKKAPTRTPRKAIKNVLKLLENNNGNLIPADLYYIAKIMKIAMHNFLDTINNNYNNALTQTHTAYVDNITVVTDIIRIYNYLLETTNDVIRPSVLLNSTNILLDAFERFFDQLALEKSITKHLDENPGEISENDRLIETIDYADIGVIVQRTSNFLIFILNPNIANVTGVAIFDAEARDSEESDEVYKNENYKFLLSNQSVDDLLYERNLEVATYVPETLWARIDEISLKSNNTTSSTQPSTIVIKLYFKDKLFQEGSYSPSRTVWGNIVSVSIPLHNKDLPEMLPLILRVNGELDSNDTDHICNYWNYTSWVSDGITFLGRSTVDENIILCGCTHLTPFAYLIGASNIVSVDSKVIIHTKLHEKALDVITLLGCCLSLLGILGIFVTAIQFQTWRQKESSKILLHLSSGIACQMILFCFVNTEETYQHLITNRIFSTCIVIGAFMHYFVLVQFCWMLLIAYLQFKRYVIVFEHNSTQHFLKKLYLLGWSLPLVPVALVLAFDKKSYVPDEKLSNNSTCYPTGYSLYFGVIFPITFIIGVNLVIYLIVMYSVFKGPDRSIRHTERSLVLSQIRLSILLYFLLGFTWIFGLLATLKMGLIFSYLFCLTATLQGFVLFIYFVILDPVTRRMWTRYVRNAFHLRNSTKNSTTAKETTQAL